MTNAIPSRTVVTSAALVLAYVASALTGLNRLAWLGTHQGRFYRTYWILMFALLLVLFVSLWRSVTATPWRAATVGLVVGYVASWLAARLMYFQLGLHGPGETLRHEAATTGVAFVLSQAFSVPVLIGGVPFGALTALLILAIARRHAKLAALLAAVVLIVAGATFFVAPSYARFKHIHFL